VDRCALFVDAGYLLSDGAMAVHGTRHRESVSWDYPGLLQLMSNLARERTGLPLLRCYWYEATVEGRRTPEHDALADIPGLKLRLSRIRPGRREGVDAQVHRDLMTLTRNSAICDAVVVSGDEDLAQVVCDAQDLGIRVTVVHIAADGSWAVSRTLRQESDDLIELSGTHLRSYVNLVNGSAESSNGHQPVSNGQAAHSLLSGAPQSGPPSLQSGQGQLTSGPGQLQPGTGQTQSGSGLSGSGQHQSGSNQSGSGLSGSGLSGSGLSGSGLSGSGLSGSGLGGSGLGGSGQHQAGSGQLGGPGQTTGPGQLPSAQSTGNHGGGIGNLNSLANLANSTTQSQPLPPHQVNPPNPPSQSLYRSQSGQNPQSSQNPQSAQNTQNQQNTQNAPPALPSYPSYQPDQPSAPQPPPINPTTPVQLATGQFNTPPNSYQPQIGQYTGPQAAPVSMPSAATAGATTLADAVKAAHKEGHDFGESVARDAPALWLEAVLARKPRMPSDLEARLLQGSSLPIDFLLHDEVRHALRRGFWDALERARR